MLRARRGLVALAVVSLFAVGGCSDGSGDGGSTGGEPIGETGDDPADATSDLVDGADEPEDATDAPPEAGTVGPDAGPAPDAAPQQVCPPESVGCVGGELFICDKGGFTFEIVPCEDGLICVGDSCVRCGDDSHCEFPEICVDGECLVPPLTIVTDALPPAVEDAAYSFTLQATGGLAPYTWSIHQGELPPGIELTEEGLISGATDVLGAWPMIIKLTDELGESVTGPLTLKVLESGLHIVTSSPLPIATDGEPYEIFLEAAGGEQPYIWGLAGGSLPSGLAVSGSGSIFGVPTDDGNFSFTIKVFDAANPPLIASKDFTLPVVIAPLEIVGDVELDLFVTKLIVLPLIIIVEGVEVPYSAQLKAIGGKKPLHWAEDALPDLVSGFIPNQGFPEGLTLHEDGSITGSVTDPSLAVTVGVPFTGLELAGFFFQAKVWDSQPVPFEESALYIIPTVPISF